MLIACVILMSFAFLFAGASLGWQILDFRQRLDVRLKLDDTMVKIQGVHNQLVKQVADLQEQVNVHEFKLSGKK